MLYLESISIFLLHYDNMFFSFHPLPQHHFENFPGEAGVMVFAAPIKGKVLQLLSHHIIYGEIVVPGWYRWRFSA